MTDNHNRKNVWDSKESLAPDCFYSPINHPRIKSELTEKIHKEWLELYKRDPVMVIDLNTLRLRPPKYK